DVRPAPHADRVDVAAKNRGHPHTALLADVHVANHLSAIVDERGGVDAGRQAPERTKHSELYRGQPALPYGPALGALPTPAQAIPSSVADVRRRVGSRRQPLELAPGIGGGARRRPRAPRTSP